MIGVTSGAASSLLGAVFQAMVDGAYLGRMASMLQIGDDVLMPLAMVVFGALAAGAGVATACAVFGLAMAVADARAADASRRTPDLAARVLGRRR